MMCVGSVNLGTSCSDRPRVLKKLASTVDRCLFTFCSTGWSGWLFTWVRLFDVSDYVIDFRIVIHAKGVYYTLTRAVFIIPIVAFVRKNSKLVAMQFFLHVHVW